MQRKWVQLIVAKAVEAFDTNAINKCRNKNMGIIGMIKRVSCLVAQRRNDIRQTDIRWNPGCGAYRNGWQQSITIICKQDDA